MHNKDIKLSILFLLITSFIISCDPDIDLFEGDEYGDTVLRGKVVDKADSIPLDSVLFSVSYSKIMQNSSYMDLYPKTDSTGTFYFEIYCMEHYAYNLGFKKEGYSSGYTITYPLVIDSGHDNYLYIEMIRDTIKTR